MATSADSSVEAVQTTELDELAINTIRFLAADAVEAAQSGHPGMPMGTAPIAYVLWQHHMRHNPSDPEWFNRDRFILSAGHGSMLLYSLLHLTGYDLPLEELKNFRQWGSRTPGHPEHFLTPGVETTTGPLGQGFANAVGLAMAERHVAARFNRPGHRIIDHYTYGIASDGDLMEGISHEAASLAGHQGLGKLIFFYDDNHITIDGSTDLAFTEDVPARFRSYHWHVERVENGNDLEAIDGALQRAKAERDRPSLIAVRTHIGYGSPNKQDTAEAHGAPLGADEVAAAKRQLGWPEEKTFYVPDEVRKHMSRAREQGRRGQANWEERLKAYRADHPELAQKLERAMAGELPSGWQEQLPTFEPGTKQATRASSKEVLEALVPAVEELMGGSADLTGSNKTKTGPQEGFQKGSPQGRYVHFGVREHAMAAACNGMALHGGVRPYCGTFLIFSDYLRPALRLSALMGTSVVYVLSHDSIGLGEDGPTHQPVEHVMALRAIPELVVVRPADANEVSEAWEVAVSRTDGPTAIALTRQGVPTLERSEGAEGVSRGAYVLSDDEETPDVILMATGSEVQHAVGAAEILRQEGRKVRVVSMPSWELFEKQPESYRQEVLPEEVKARVSVEAGVTQGWERYVGDGGAMVGLDRFGASAPGGRLMEEFGFTAAHVADKARELL